MPTNPAADFTAQLVTDPALADHKIQVVGDQVVVVDPADVGKALTVDSDGNLVFTDVAAKDASNLDGPDVDAWRAALNLDTSDGLPVRAGQWNRLGGPGVTGTFRGGTSGAAWLNVSTVTSLSTTGGEAAAIGGSNGANPTLVNLNGFHYVRRFFLQPCTFDRLAIRQIVQGPAGSTMDLMVYDDEHPTNPGYPGDLQASASLAMDTAGANVTRGVPFAYEHPGGYGWIGARFLESPPSGAAGSMVGIVVAGETGGYQVPYVDVTSLPSGVNGVAHNGYLSTGITGALGDDPATAFLSNVVPSVWAHIASVP